MDFYDRERIASGRWFLIARVGFISLLFAFDLVAWVLDLLPLLTWRAASDLAYGVFCLGAVFAARRWVWLGRHALWFLAMDTVFCTLVQARALWSYLESGEDPVVVGTLLGTTFAVYAIIVAAAQLALDRRVVAWATVWVLIGTVFLAVVVVGRPIDALAGCVVIGTMSLVSSYLPTRVPGLVAVAAEQLANERLLFRLLPRSVAVALRESPDTVIAARHESVSVLFADVVGFTPLARRLPPEQLVAELNRIFCQFDVAAETHGVEKLKTIGDCYMAACGVPQARPDHAEAMVSMALEMLTWIEQNASDDLRFRIGVHSGPVIAGVIGRDRIRYDIWGDTVNLASRLESTGVPGRVHISSATRTLLKHAFETEARGTLDLKGIGTVETWLVKHRP